MNDVVSSQATPAPLDSWLESWRHDLLSGFLVFLIALPLCLGIANACGYPPIAGIFTAVIGGILSGFISNSQLTIKGPAAGLIVIALGCIQDFSANASASEAYRLALGVGVAAAIIQIVLALCRSGILGEFFPTSAVHGMLAAIGVIIIAKQLPVTLGVDNKGEPLQLLASIPDKLMHMNPEIAAIGGISLLILFGLPLLRSRWVRRIPAPMVVVLVAIPLGMFFDLAHQHTYTFGQSDYQVGEQYLVAVPNSMFSAVTFPDFAGLSTATGWKWVIMFALIGSLESILSAKAIDTLDPWRRKTNLNRALLAVGAGNLASAFVGGLPMISEIVRSKANIDNGARTRLANLFHGVFLLLFVALAPALIHRIPLAALGAMLVYTGFRLASPREFVNVFKIGKDQFVVFTTTLVAVLATDLLMGILIGMAAEIFLHVFNGAPLRSLFKPATSTEERSDGTRVIAVKYAAVFSSWILLRRKLIMSIGQDSKKIILDLSETRLVDHTVMEKLHELQKEFQEHDRHLVITGLENHRTFSDHPHAARKKVAVESAGA